MATVVVVALAYIAMIAFTVYVGLALVRMSKAVERISQILEERFPRTPLT